ncbi:MAG: hydroxyacid dehydrogenase [Phycisphaeraceae bacterium]|nr:hydroxyacid dehydrogenase [Phycisphaeraceae bacterium]
MTLNDLYQVTPVKILFYLPPDVLNRCFRQADLQRLQPAHTLLVPQQDSWQQSMTTFWAHHAADLDAVVTGWDTPHVTDGMLDQAPGLKIWIHSAGSVKHLLPDTFWQRGIALASCRDALAVGVAETTLGMMIAGLKRIFPAERLTRSGLWKNDAFASALRVRELFDLQIGIVGASRVGRHLIRLLQVYEVSIVVYDPYLTPSDAQQLGVQSVTLDELMRNCDVISLHAPALPETRHMIGNRELNMMKDDAILINTARGSLIDEPALVAALQTGRISALLDVTDPEPPAVDHPLRALPNCVITPHIAGAISNGCYRMGRSSIDQLLAFARNQTLSGHIDQDSIAILG